MKDVRNVTIASLAQRILFLKDVSNVLIATNVENPMDASQSNGTWLKNSTNHATNADKNVDIVHHALDVSKILTVIELWISNVRWILHI